MTSESEQPAPATGSSLGLVAFIIGLIGLVMAFIPFIGMVAWLLAPLAILFGGLALLRTPGAFGIAGLVLGILTLVVCLSWLRAVQTIGQSIAPNVPKGDSRPAEKAAAPIVTVSIQGLSNEFEENRIAALSKYSNRRLLFREEEIQGFRGDAARPLIEFAARRDQYLTYLMPVPFPTAESQRIIGLRKGQKISFVCTEVREGFGAGYSLGDCALQ